MARMLVALKGERDQRQRELERAAQQISVARDVKVPRSARF
jgi:hypothetical protein